MLRAEKKNESNMNTAVSNFLWTPFLPLRRCHKKDRVEETHAVTRLGTPNCGLWHLREVKIIGCLTFLHTPSI